MLLGDAKKVTAGAAQPYEEAARSDRAALNPGTQSRASVDLLFLGALFPRRAAWLGNVPGGLLAGLLEVLYLTAQDLELLLRVLRLGLDGVGHGLDAGNLPEEVEERFGIGLGDIDRLQRHR